jgi:hypothetical protein
MPRGGKAVFFVQGNHAISIYVFDVANTVVSFAGGDIAGRWYHSPSRQATAPLSVVSVHDDEPSRNSSMMMRSPALVAWSDRDGDARSQLRAE